MKKNKINNIKIDNFPNEMGVNKLNILSSMLERVGVSNVSATNKKIREYGILLECSCCCEKYCLKSYSFKELMVLNIKEEIFELLTIRENSGH
ncbi:hypothetical protein G9F72_024055 [Clostridium estertheticum]|uniref:hypothetical protein n=1 Tax=Clostridium estertheticum TaxID=238834 RepID=UPI0013E93921|nr:hypothetical protein [Clostridium estertheticum]MBZ9689375.1 hypothetical protein [Clostridium estertheticum]